MNKWNKYIDAVFLALIGIVFVISVYDNFSDGNRTPVNTYAAYLCWGIIVFLKVKRLERSDFLVLGLLLLGIFNIVSFTIEIYSFGSRISWLYEGYYVLLAAPGISPLSILLFIIYFAVNSKTVTKAYYKLFSPSDKEVVDKFTTLTKFYYEKFTVYNDEQFEKVVSDVNEYPLEAQESIKRILTERNVVASLPK